MQNDYATYTLLTKPETVFVCENLVGFRKKISTNEIVTAFIRNACWSFRPFLVTRPPKITVTDICPPYLP